MGDLVVYGLKIGLVLATAIVFMTAISTLIGMMTELFFPSIITEVLGIISACLPFDAGTIFSALGTVCNGILSFMVAAKIWDLTVTVEDAS